MKRLSKIFLTTILIIALTCNMAFAAGEITEKEIQEGLDFCADYPVSLAYDGEKITFSSKDVPPVIITPAGDEYGRTLIPARALFEKMGATVDWNNDEQSVTIKNTDYTIKLVIGSDKATVNGVQNTLDVPALIIDHDHDYFGSTMIPVRFVAEALGYNVEWLDATRTVAVTKPLPVIPDEPEVIEPEVQEPVIVVSKGFPDYNMAPLPKAKGNARGKLIVIDPGHGGKDVGSIANENKANELYEKNLNLPVALKVADYLKEAGFNVRMTREKDIFVDLHVRPEFGNQLHADFFLCIHNNSSENPAAKGTEVCYNDKEGNLEEYGITSLTVAKAIQKEMVAALGTYDRGPKLSPDLVVLKYTVMPAVIVEGAFLSNPEDFAKMQKTDYIERYAYAVSKAVITVFNETYN